MKIFRLFVAFTLVCFVLSQRSQGVVPPPPGGYPNFTTAAGDHALQALTLGLGNTALGTFSLFSVTTGSFNTAVGAGALDLNTADSNTAVGTAALLFNTTGTENTAVGTAALEFNETSEQNTATGAFALFSHISGNGNTANGWHALFSDTTGQLNTAIGLAALANDNNGFNGSFNTAVGASALFANNGADNTAVGAGALQSNTTGNDNTAIGISALVTSQTGDRNIAVGNFAGAGLATGSDNIYIGANLGGAAGESNTCYIKSIFGQTNNLGTAVFIDANHKLGTLTSSKRFKEDIKPVGKASESLFALKPVTFHYKKEIDPASKSQFGLVAEEVEKVNPDLVVRDHEGKPYSVRYDQVNAMLLNEFLKEHRAFVEQQQKVEEQGVTIAHQQKQIEALTAGLQKVSAQLEVSKPAPQTVLNNQ
jgi:trimeric autotransporter adhesin